jgi:hypothetical protein
VGGGGGGGGGTNWEYFTFSGSIHIKFSMTG